VFVQLVLYVTLIYLQDMEAENWLSVIKELRDGVPSKKGNYYNLLTYSLEILHFV